MKQTEPVMMSWCCAVADTNHLHSSISHLLPCSWNGKLRTWLTWLADRTGRWQFWTGKLQQRFSLQNSKKVPWWSSNTSAHQDGSCYLLCMTTREVVLCPLLINKGNNKTNYLRSVWWASLPKSTECFFHHGNCVGRCGRSSIQVPTCCSVPSFYGCLPTPRSNFGYPFKAYAVENLICYTFTEFKSSKDYYILMHISLLHPNAHITALLISFRNSV